MVCANWPARLETYTWLLVREGKTGAGDQISIDRLGT